MNRLQWLPAAPRRRRPASALTVALALLLGAVVASAATDEDTLRLTPARLGYLEGDVSFWRPGAGDWEAATVNIPLAAGDALASRDGRFEVQIGPQAFLRGGEQTQLRVTSQEPDFLQLNLTQGGAVLDLRRLPAGHVVEIDTPSGAVTAARDGFYRIDVDADATRLAVRRAGAASLTPPGGQAIQVATGEAVSVRGGAAAQYEVIAAPAFDEWDRWNYARADSFLAAPRAATVSADLYGAAELDAYGSWRYVQTYGRVWVPYSVPIGWAPYTAGRWLWDPVYGWSWVDYSPWGWAPFHYGRWVYTGYWAWAPGPVVVTPVYAPALVAFFSPAVSISVGFGAPYIGWTALGWGEPLVPWWGGIGFAGVPCWYGWGGPRVVNNIVINTGDDVHPGHIDRYRNADMPGGLVGVPKEHFGAPDVPRARLAHLTSKDVIPLRADAPAASTADAAPRGVPGGGLADLARTHALEHARVGATAEVPNRPAGAPERAGVAPLPKSATRPTAFDRLRTAGATAPGRVPAATWQAPSAPRSLNRVENPPPLREIAKPAASWARAYQHGRDTDAARTRASASAPRFERVGRAPAPVAKQAESPPRLQPRRATDAGTAWSSSLQPAPSRPRAVASNYDRAPTADFASAPKAPAMPRPDGGGGGASVMGGPPGGGSGAPNGGGWSGGPPVGGGGRPNFSR